MWVPILIALWLPRVVIAFLYLLTDWFGGVFQTRLWPILGFIFMPYTMLWYSAVSHWYGGVWETFQILVLIIAVFADLSSGKKGTERQRL